MRHSVLAFGALTAMASACTGANETDGSGSDECGEAVTRLETAMEGDISVGAVMPLQPGIETPTRERGDVEIDVAPLVAIGRTDVLLDGRRVDAQALIDDIRTMERNWDILHPSGGPPTKRLNVLADARVDFARVDEVLQPLGELGYTFVLVAATPAVPPTPCPADWPECASLLTGDPSTRAMQVADAMTGAIGRSCSEVVEVFGRIASVDMERKAEELRDGLPAALRTCECRGVNMERLQWLVPRMLGTGDARPVGMPYEAGRAGTVGAWMSTE